MGDIHAMMLGKPTVLQSQFRLTNTMILNLLRLEALRVTDMMRSFSENHRDTQAHEKRIRELRNTLSSLPPLDTEGQLSDILSYNHAITELRITTETLQQVVLESVNGLKALSVGMVVIVNNGQHQNTLGVILQVLEALQYVDSSGAVQLKGHVACHELLLTELLFENTLSPLAPEESAALLSCLVFTQNTQIDPHITNTLQEPFSAIELTDMQEGTIVCCIQSLDEVLKEVRQAARIVGDSVLGNKMERASLAIRRDIVFNASLFSY